MSVSSLLIKNCCKIKKQTKSANKQITHMRPTQLLHFECSLYSQINEPNTNLLRLDHFFHYSNMRYCRLCDIFFYLKSKNIIKKGRDTKQYEHKQ